MPPPSTMIFTFAFSYLAKNFCSGIKSRAGSLGSGGGRSSGVSSASSLRSSRTLPLEVFSLTQPAGVVVVCTTVIPSSLTFCWTTSTRVPSLCSPTFSELEFGPERTVAVANTQYLTGAAYTASVNSDRAFSALATADLAESRFVVVVSSRSVREPTSISKRLM